MKYETVPTIVEAIQWNEDNYIDVHRFCDGYDYMNPNGVLFISSLEGVMKVKKGTYIVKGVLGYDFYVCDETAFNKKYKPLEENEEKKWTTY